MSTIVDFIYLNHKTCTRWRRWVSFSDKEESDVDNRNKRNKPTLSADAIQPWVPGFGLNRILKKKEKRKNIYPIKFLI